MILTDSTYNQPRGFHCVILEKNGSPWFYNTLLRHLKLNGYCMIHPCPVILVSVKNDIDIIVKALIPRSDMLANRNSSR